MTAPSANEPGTPVVHPDLAALAPLIGTWSGTGHGSYPTIEPFDYREELLFAPVGDRPFLRYSQRTWDARDGRPLHVETGYLRAGRPDAAELVVAQPTGVVEVDEGAVASEGPGHLEVVLRSRSVAVSSTAKEVTEVERVFSLGKGVLRTRVAISAVGQPLTPHLASELRPPPASNHD